MERGRTYAVVVAHAHGADGRFIGEGDVLLGIHGPNVSISVSKFISNDTGTEIGGQRGDCRGC